MNIYKEKQRNFFDLADSYFCEATNDYVNLRVNYRVKDDKDLFLFKIATATKMGLACEYYLKGLLLPLLDIRIPDDIKSIELEKIMNSLTEEEKYNIIIGNNKDIINKISSTTGIKKSKLDFLKNNNLKTNQHNIIKIINQIDDNAIIKHAEITKDYYDNKITAEEYDEKLKMIDGCVSLKVTLISYLKNRTHLFRRDNKILYTDNIDKELEAIKKLRNYKNNEIISWENECNELFELVETVLNEANIYNSFSEARYGHLDNNYDLDLRLLCDCMIEIKNCTYIDNCMFLELEPNGVKIKYPNIKKINTIKRIYPDIDSNIYIIKNGEIKKSYIIESFNLLVNDLKSKNNLDVHQENIIKQYNEQANLYYDYLGCIQEYGVEKYCINENPYNYISGVGETCVFNNLKIGKDEVICYYENGNLIICYNQDNERIFRLKEKYNEQANIIIQEFEKNKNNNKKYIMDKEYLNYIFCNYNFSSRKQEKNYEKYL